MAARDKPPLPCAGGHQNPDTGGTEAMPSLNDGMHGAVITVPKIGAQRCATCKFQGQLAEWGDTKLCLAHPAGITAVWQYAINFIGLLARKVSRNEEVFQGNITKDAHFPPAPDHWWCGEWRPRFLNEAGDQLK
ncbi:MAG: hypothetical protein KGL39_03420 [Patescibacteria group bacterium]|nr:hypothetical protein [Patescibacteria group bacterium]